jgi:hypothetical protein
MEKQRAKAAERARRKLDREANPTGYIIEAYDPDDLGDVEESDEETPKSDAPDAK